MTPVITRTDQMAEAAAVGEAVIRIIIIEMVTITKIINMKMAEVKEIITVAAEVEEDEVEEITKMVKRRNTTIIKIMMKMSRQSSLNQNL